MSYRMQDVDYLRECFIAAEINFSFPPATYCATYCVAVETLLMTT